MYYIYVQGYNAKLIAREKWNREKRGKLNGNTNWIRGLKVFFLINSGFNVIHRGREKNLGKPACEERESIGFLKILKIKTVTKIVI